MMTSGLADPVSIVDPFFAPHGDEATLDPRMARWRTWFLRLLVIGALAWELIAFAVAPSLIRSGYANTSSIEALNRAFDHRHDHAVGFYIREFYKFAIELLGVWFTFGLLVLGTTSRTFARRMIGKATPGTLGAIRVLTCLVLAGVVLFAPIDLGFILPGIYKAIAIIALLMGAVGIATRPMLILATILCLPIVGIPLYILLVLIFTRSGDGWSLDRLIRLWKGKPVPPRDVATPYYGWARYACWMVLVIPFVCAGLSELTNSAVRAAYMPSGVTMLSGITIVIELGMGAVLLSRIARFVLPIMTAAILVGLPSVPAWDLATLQLIFYDWTKVRHWLGHRVNAQRGSIDVLYDGRCALCQRSVRLLKAWDLLDRLNYLDFRTLDLVAYDAARHVTLDSAELERAMHVVRKGRVNSGFAGCRRIAGALPISWMIVPLLWLPGLSHVGGAAYRWLARNRMAFHTCDTSGACAIDTSKLTAIEAAPILTTAFGPLDAPMHVRLRGPAVIIAIACVMVAAWALRVGWFPLALRNMIG